MKLAPIPDNEQERLHDYNNYNILSTQYQQDFDELVQLASEICNVPISLISLMGASTQSFQAIKGLAMSEADRGTSFCGHAILNDELFVVEDALTDERFYDNPAVINEPSIRFYAGMPLISKRGFRLGTLCVIDRIPRHLDDGQIFAIKTLSKQALKLFELRLSNKQLFDQATVLHKQKQRLEELNGAQNKIISIISHDIKSPLNALKQVISLKDTHVISQRQVSSLMATINTQIDGTIDMLSNLIEWGSILINKTDIKKEPINLYNFVNRSLNSVVVTALLKNNQLVNNVSDKLLFVASDENILKFIFVNLIVNANKFTAGGRIIISAEQQDTNVLIHIDDTGTGMSNEVLNKLFITGNTINNTGNNNENGNVLNLFFVKDFLDKLDTKLHIESVLGKGTSVVFTLPIG